MKISFIFIFGFVLINVLEQHRTKYLLVEVEDNDSKEIEIHEVNELVCSPGFILKNWQKYLSQWGTSIYKYTNETGDTLKNTNLCWKLAKEHVPNSFGIYLDFAIRSTGVCCAIDNISPLMPWPKKFPNYPKETKLCILRALLHGNCSDGIKNQDETGVDCGGSICPPCSVPGHIGYDAPNAVEWCAINEPTDGRNGCDSDEECLKNGRNFCDTDPNCFGISWYENWIGQNLKICRSTVMGPKGEGWRTMMKQVPHHTYIQLKKKGCEAGKYGNFNSVVDAEAACSMDSNCTSVYDQDCVDSRNRVYLCRLGSSYEPSSLSCVYVQQDFCKLPVEFGRCYMAIPRVYFDQASGKCKKFIYGGCGGNENNFKTQEACEKKCRVFY